MCCREGNYRMNTFKRTTKEQRPNQQSSRKINSVCISRLYVDKYSDHVEVQYVSAHTNHELCTSELQYLPLPQSSMDGVALKVSRGIATERIMGGLFILIFTVCTMNNHNFCYQIFERGLGIESTDIHLSKKCLESTSCQNKTSAMSKEVYLIDKSSAMRMMPCL